MEQIDKIAKPFIKWAGGKSQLSCEKKNNFNVPIGSYKKHIICGKDNLRAVNRILQKVIMLNEDFEDTLEYAKDEFDDNEKVRLAKFCEQIDLLGYKWILSNSDVKGKNLNDSFFDDLYSTFNILRVKIA